MWEYSWVSGVGISSQRVAADEPNLQSAVNYRLYRRSNSLRSLRSAVKSRDCIGIRTHHIENALYDNRLATYIAVEMSQEIVLRQ